MEHKKSIPHTPDIPRNTGHGLIPALLPSISGMYGRADENFTEKKGYTIEKKTTIHYGAARSANGQPLEANNYTARVFLRAKTLP